MNLFDDVNDKLFAFEQLYNDILEEHTPLKQTIVRGNQVPYMNEQWRKAIRHRNKLWRKFTKDRTDTNYKQYRIQRNKCTSLRRKAIKEHFLKKSTSSDNPREFWNAYRPFLHGKTKQAKDNILEENNVVMTEKSSVADLFNNNFLQATNSVAQINDSDYGQDFKNHPSIIAIHQHYRDINTPLSFVFHCTNCVQVEKLLKGVNVNKSSGHNMIPPQLIKASAAVIAERIANIFNASIAQGCYPGVWKMGQVTPLFKKNDEFKKENYRPVTVLPVLNNIYERLLVAQLGDFYQAILSDFISSYRRFYSCETALLKLAEDWRAMLDRGELVALVSMDLSKAFCVIQHNLLLAKFKAYGVGERSFTLFKDYLSGRQQRVKIGDTFFDWKGVKRGVPQGSVLGPVFFNIFINNLFYSVTQGKLHAYPDDHQLYSSGVDPVALEKCICCAVRVANEWYRSNGMIVNDTKHQAIVLGKTDHSFSFPLKDSLDIFGINIDNRLRFDDYISAICKKINDQFNVMQRFCKRISKDTLIRLYKAFIMPHFNYCSSVWHFCGAHSTEKIDTLNKRILRFILQDFKSPYNSLLSKVNSKSLYKQRLQTF